MTAPVTPLAEVEALRLAVAVGARATAHLGATHNSRATAAQPKDTTNVD